MNLLNGIWQGLALFAGGLVTILLAYARGRASGRHAERMKGLEQTLRNMETRDEIDRDVAGASSADVRDRLRDDARR